MLLDSNQNKQRILDEFLKICQFDGWNNDALLHALRNCGIDENLAPVIFENGLLDLTNFYIESQNHKVLAQLNLEGKKIREKIRLSLYVRFEIERENKLALQQLVSFYTNPKNFTSIENGPRPLINGLAACYKIADAMWKTINDQSTDFNYYTKRLTLAKIVMRTLFVFLKDDSTDLSKTKKFIDLEIEKVMNFEKIKGRFKSFSARSKKIFCEFILDEKGTPKSPKELIKNLPFIRLIKF